MILETKSQPVTREVCSKDQRTPKEGLIRNVSICIKDWNKVSKILQERFGFAIREPMKSSWFSVLQRVGQSLMVPVSVLPAAGLMVALGRVLQQFAESHSWPVMKIAGDLAFNGGLAIFQQLPVVFAVGVAIGFTGGAGVAALAAVAGYFTLANVLAVMTTALGLSLKIDTGVFGGILVGLMSAYLYNRYHTTELHPVLGFFSGKRLIPILTTASALVLGLLLSAFWPPIQSQIEQFGQWVMGSPLGPAFYAAGKRLLIPLGLHHVFYPPFLYQFGEFTTAAGQVVKGETARYFAGDPTAGRFMASEFPLMLFGLPAACLAMYLRAKPARRKAVGGVMLAAQWLCGKPHLSQQPLCHRKFAEFRRPQQARRSYLPGCGRPAVSEPQRPAVGMGT